MAGKEEKNMQHEKKNCMEVEEEVVQQQQKQGGRSHVGEASLCTGQRTNKPGV